MMWVMLALCFIVSFLFAGLEAGILSISPVRLSHQVRLKNPRAIRLQALLRRPERLLLTVLLVTDFINISALVLLTRICTDQFGNIGYLVAFGLAIPTWIIFLEMLPRSIFRRFPYRLLAGFSEILTFVTTAFSPLVQVLVSIGKRVFHMEESRNLFIARDELKAYAVEVEKSGSLTSTEREMIHNVVDFRNIKARDVMFSLDQFPVITSETPVGEVLAVSKERHLDRLPVTDENGKIIGLVRAFDILLDGRLDTRAGHHLRRIVTAQLDEPAYQVIRKLRAARLSLAAVIDENGQPAGVVRPEDLIDRLIAFNVHGPKSDRPAAPTFA
ncbi:MAG TPA: CNNM domain-containing protein [Chthoniobacterales bacterium]